MGIAHARPLEVARQRRWDTRRQHVDRDFRSHLGNLRGCLPDGAIGIRHYADAFAFASTARSRAMSFRVGRLASQVGTVAGSPPRSARHPLAPRNVCMLAMSAVDEGRRTEMPKDDGEVWVQLATRIPKGLHRTLKLYCVTHDTSVMAFVVAALEEKLARDSHRTRSASRQRG